jgi:hypothetical protein
MLVEEMVLGVVMESDILQKLQIQVMVEVVLMDQADQVLELADQVLLYLSTE